MDLPAGELSFSLSNVWGRAKQSPMNGTGTKGLGINPVVLLLALFQRQVALKSWLIYSSYQVLNIVAKKVLGNDYSYKPLKHL